MLVEFAEGAQPILIAIAAVLTVISLVLRIAKEGLPLLGAKRRNAASIIKSAHECRSALEKESELGAILSDACRDMLAQDAAELRFPRKIGCWGKNFICLILWTFVFVFPVLWAKFLSSSSMSVLLLPMFVVGLLGMLMTTPLLMLDVPSYPKACEKWTAEQTRRKVKKDCRGDDSLKECLKSAFLPLGDISGLTERSRGCYLLDARSKKQWLKDGLPGSVSIEDFDRAVLGSETNVLVYSNFGGRSIERVRDLLESNVNAFDLGGIAAMDREFRCVAEALRLLGRWSGAEMAANNVERGVGSPECRISI